MRAVYAIGHHQPCPQTTTVDKLLHWLFRNAVWDGCNYTDQVIPTELQPEGYTPTWCSDIHLLQAHSATFQSALPFALPSVCVRLGGST